MSTHDQQPRTKKEQRDLTPEELAFLHAAPSHERTTGNGNRRRGLLIGGGVGIAGLVAGVVLTVGGGGDKAPAEKNDRVNEGTSQSEAPVPQDIDPTVAPGEPCEEAWCEYWTAEDVMSDEHYPTFKEKAGKAFDIITVAANDPGPTREGITYKYDEALLGGAHYDTDMKHLHQWLDGVSQSVGHINYDFPDTQPELVIKYELEDIVEQINKDTAIVEVEKTDNSPEFDPEYQDRIKGYLKDINLTGQETTYYRLSLRHEEGRGLVKELTLLDDYEPPAK